MKCLGFFTSQIWYVFPLELDLQSAQVKPLPKGEFMFAHNELQLLLLRCLWYMKFLRTSVCLSGADKFCTLVWALGLLLLLDNN